MLRLNTRQWVLVSSIIICTLVYLVVSGSSDKYTLTDLQTLLDTLNLDSLNSLTKTVTDQKDQKGHVDEEKKTVDLEKQINELLEQRLNTELQLERDSMQKDISTLETKLKKADDEAAQALKSLGLAKVSIESLDLTEAGKDHFYKTTLSFKTRPDEDTTERLYDPLKNQLVVMSLFGGSFGEGRTFEDFLKLIHGLKSSIKAAETSLSVLISDLETYNEVSRYMAKKFETISEINKLQDLTDHFSRVTLLHAPFLEEKLKLQREDRHDPKVQRTRRRVLSEMRNFLMFHGINDEIYTLFIDSDMTEIPETMLQKFIDSKVDIATVRVGIKDKEGTVKSVDYDRNSWAGTRKKPTKEEEQKLTDDPTYFFEPKPEESIYLWQLWREPEKYGLDKTDGAKYELKSVGGAVLFAKSEVFRVGAIFPPFYAIGSEWERSEGWDGIETEGLCYVANVLGYKCWGFPNMVAYHTSWKNTR